MASGITVNGELISEESILAEMQYHPAGELPRQQAADALVVRCLLLQEAKRLQIEAQPNEIAPGRFEVEDEAQIRVLLEQEVDVQEPPAEACRQYYEDNTDQFFSPEIFEARHILFAADPNDFEAIEFAHSKASTIIGILQHEPHRFEEFARTESDCTSRSSGGHLGQLSIGQTVPEFETVMVELQPGELSLEPVRTRFGVHVVRMDKRERGRQLPFDSVYEKIREHLTAQLWRDAVRRFIKHLSDQAIITGWQQS